MMRERLYGWGVEAVRVLMPTVGAVRPARAIRIAERRAAAARLEEWAAGGRDMRLPLIWLHAASAGEVTSVVPVVRRMRGLERIQVLVTCTSPAGLAAAEAVEAEYTGFAPLDAPSECRRAARALRADALVFAKWDVWPAMTAAAAEVGAGVGLVNATVSETSSRLRAPARWWLRSAYRRLRVVGAATEADARRLLRLGVEPDALRVVGDAALDAALERADRPGPAGREAARKLRALTGRWSGRGASAGPGPGSSAGSPFLLVAGSTWPEDEAVLLEASAALERRGRFVQLVLVPHRPDPPTVARLVERCRTCLGRPPLLWSGADAAGAGASPSGERGERNRSPRAVVVDRVGVLADLYAVGDAAYVGGGWGERGLHSVVEPAAAGRPVLFGLPGRRWEATLLVERGGARGVARTELPDVLDRWIGDESRRIAMGRAARRAVEEHAGAADGQAELVLELAGMRVASRVRAWVSRTEASGRARTTEGSPRSDREG